MLSLEQIEEGRRLLAEGRCSCGDSCPIGPHVSSVEFRNWLADNAEALLDAAEQAHMTEEQRLLDERFARLVERDALRVEVELLRAEVERLSATCAHCLEQGCEPTHDGKCACCGSDL